MKQNEASPHAAAGSWTLQPLTLSQNKIPFFKNDLPSGVLSQQCKYIEKMDQV
jgi:hypothetical protein